MKCIDAEWEVRNLGVKTIELSVERKDTDLSPKDFLNTIENFRLQYDAKYVVIKADTRYSSISLELQKSGFWLIENQIGLRAARRDVLKAVEDFKKNFADGVSYRVANETDKQLILAEIEKNMFTTDRIALDPHFGLEIANRRYAFWLQDEINRGTGLYVFLFNGEACGFFLHKSDLEKNAVNDLLGGCFNFFKSKHNASGGMMFYSGRLSFLDSGRKVHKTFVSSNNLGSLNLHLALGSKIIEIKNVFVKHFD